MERDCKDSRKEKVCPEFVLTRFKLPYAYGDILSEAQPLDDERAKAVYQAKGAGWSKRHRNN